MKELIERYRKATSKGKVLIIISVLLILVLLSAVSVYVLGISLRNIPGSDKNLSPFYYALETRFGRPLSIAFVIVILFAFLLLFLSANKKNYVKSDDSRGVHYMEQATHGSAEWMDRERAKEVFTVTDIRNTNEVVYGQFTSKGEEVVGYRKPQYAEFNRNIFVLAPSGSGKTFTQVKTDFVQHIKAGNSVALTDPDGGLYGDFANWCRERNVKVHVINFADPAYSECWDMIKECIDPETERLDGTRLNMFVNTFMVNTGEGTKDFFYKSATNLIKAVIGYTFYFNEKEILDGYGKLYLHVSDISNKTNDEYFKRVENGPVSLKWCRYWILKTAVRNGYREEEIEDLFVQIKKAADEIRPFTMGAVYNNIIEFKGFEKFMESDENPIATWHPAYTNYLVYKSNDNDQVRKSAIQGAQLRFEMFIDPNITYILSRPGLDLKKFNTEQTALFVMTQDKSDETDPIASILFTFLFKDIQDVYDRNRQIAQGNSGINPCLGSAVILDDFFSLGVIGGDPKLFAKTMADARKRQVYITIVVQQYSQVEALYGSKYNHSIQGNCATLIYLGGNDPETIEFISEFAGEATALDESHDERASILQLNTLKPGYRSSATKRDLLTKGEARTWKDHVLVIQQGEQPLDLSPFTWVELPEYLRGEFRPTSVYRDLRPIYEREGLSFKTEGQKEEETITDLDSMILKIRKSIKEKQPAESLDHLFEDAQDEQDRFYETINAKDTSVPERKNSRTSSEERADEDDTEQPSFARLRKEE